MAARADKVSRVDHDGVTLVEGATSDVRFAFTERAGGVSEDAYSSLNLGSHVGDDPFAVQENRRRALEAMGAAECEHNLLVPNQVHGDHIVAVTSNGADDLEDVREQIAEGCDAIVCTAHNVPVLLCFADCVPVVLVAPGGFAVVHSGWKGISSAETENRQMNKMDSPNFAMLPAAMRATFPPISAPISWVTNMRYPRNSWIALPPSSLASMRVPLACSIFPLPFARRW